MFKVNFAESSFPSHQFFKIFKTKEQADQFIQALGSRFISIKTV